MKTQEQIEEKMAELDDQGTRYPGMTYEQGVDEALRWVLEEIADEEFCCP
mgnify:CR=1 FL=1